MKSHITIQTKFNKNQSYYTMSFYEWFNQCQHKQNKLKENKSNSGRFYNLRKYVVYRK